MVSNVTKAIGAEAQITNSALRPLAGLIGEWRTTGQHPMVPGKTFHGRTAFAWQDNGAFLVMRSEIDEPEIPSGIAYFGSDDGTHAIAMFYFDERGVSRHYAVSTEGKSVSWSRNDPKLAQTMTLTIEPDRLIARGRMSRDGGDWEDDLSLTYERVHVERP
jgi:hypothetical protein